MGEFNVQLQEHEEAVVIRLVGELTVDHADPLQRQLSSVVGEQPSAIVLDVSELRFICSSGLGVLVAFRKALTEQGATLRLAGAAACVADVLRKTRLSELFPMYPDADQALQASGQD